MRCHVHPSCLPNEFYPAVAISFSRRSNRRVATYSAPCFAPCVARGSAPPLHAFTPARSNDVVTIGEVPESLVSKASDGHIVEPWPAQLNKLVWEGGHDLVISVGQVVPHEVMGMANYNKNLFVGVGGSQAINLSHMIGAV